MPFSFRQKLELIQQQALETETETSARAPLPLGMSFENWLLLRLKHFKGQRGHQALLNCGPLWYSRLKLGLFAAGFMLGLLSVWGLLPTQERHINLFWLFTAVLGAHSFALMLWLLFVALLRGHNSGPVATATTWVVNKLLSFKPVKAQTAIVLKQWWDTRLLPQFRVWQLGLFTHIFWLAFLIGSALALIIIFTTQQFDFNWQSTLLSHQQQATILTLLAAPQHLFGLEIPSSEASAELQRRAWALFILFSTLLYGLLPRLLALLFTSSYLLWQQSKWQLDLSQRYFIHLRNQFNLQQQRPMILDHDPAPPSTTEKEVLFSDTPPPENADWYGIEVDTQLGFETLVPNFKGYINSLSEAQALASTKQPKNAPIVFFVEGHRLADRGQKRILKSLLRNKTWLAILNTRQTETENLQQWQQVADELQWPAQRLVLFAMEQQG